MTELDKIIRVHGEANALLKQYGLAEEGWTFKLSGTKNAIGMCRHSLKQIEFSKWFLNSDPAEITDTLLHEIAHALVGKGHGHNALWKAKAREVGADPYANKEDVVTTATYNYVMRCPSCGREWKRYRMKQRNFGSKCPDCKVEVKIFKYVKR